MASVAQQRVALLTNAFGFDPGETALIGEQVRLLDDDREGSLISLPFR